MQEASIGPYRVTERLGAGGMGEVYLAVDTRLNRKVALKYLLDPSLDTPRARERLLSEARAAAKITHPNIAAIYDILDTSEPPCIVMEYAEGESLSIVAGRGPLPCATVVDIGLQLADALAHAHAAGVIHRDLKPSNVVLTPDGVVKVLDFGVARVLDTEQELAAASAPTRDATQTRAGRIAGTPAYMAPEQLGGFAASPLSDIYSLGATLYELSTGKRPFGGGSTSEVIFQVLSKPTPLANAANGAVSPLVTAIVAKAMAKEREARYASADLMAEDLRRAAAECAGESSGIRSSTSVAGSVAQELAAMSSRRGMVALAGAVLLGALLVAVWYAQWGRVAPPSTAVGSQFVAVVPFTSDAGNPITASEAAGFSEAIVASLEGLSSVSVLSSRRGAARFVESSGDIRKQLAALGVTMIVSGKVSASGNSRKVAVRIETPDLKPVFSKTYSDAAVDAATVESRSVQDIVGALRVALTPADRERMQRIPACRPETYAMVADGRVSLDRPDVAGNRMKAESIFRKAASADPACALATAALADACISVYMETKDPKWMAEADRSIQQAYTLDPVSPSIRTSMAVFYSGIGKYDQAEKVIRQVMAQRPFDDESHRILSDVLGSQGRTEEAIAEIRQAIGLRPNNVVNHIILGNMSLDAGRYAEAAKSYEQVLAIQSDNSWAASNLCAAYSGMSDFQRAMECYRALPPDATNLTNLGVSYLSLGRYQEAVDVCRKAVEMEPRSEYKRWNLADAYLRLGDKPKAMEQYRQAAALTEAMLKVNSQDARVMARHAFYDARLGRADDAVRHATMAVDLAPHDSAVMYRRAVVHCVLGQSADAVSWLERALQAGYDAKRAAADSDLDPIKKLPRVQELLRSDR